MDTTNVIPESTPPPRVRVGFPVLMKEMRSRMRGNRAPLLLAVAAGLAILVGLLILYFSLDNLSDDASAIGEMANVGRMLFLGLSTLMGILVTFIAPGVTAGAISTEREKHTLEMLLLTRLSNLNIVLGKYFSALGFLFLIIICALPVMAISFLLGGVDPALLGWSLEHILAVALIYGAIGLYFSARFRTTITAVVYAYAVCVGYGMLLPTFSGVMSVGYMAGAGGSLDPVLMVVQSGISAIMPTFLISGICASFPRCNLTALRQVLIWSVFTAIFVYVFNSVSASVSSHTPPIYYLMYGLGLPNAIGSSYARMHMGVAFSTPWYTYLISVGMHLFFIFALLALTVKRIRMARERT